MTNKVQKLQRACLVKPVKVEVASSYHLHQPTDQAHSPLMVFAICRLRVHHHD